MFLTSKSLQLHATSQIPYLSVSYSHINIHGALHISLATKVYLNVYVNNHKFDWKGVFTVVKFSAKTKHTQRVKVLNTYTGPAGSSSEATREKIRRSEDQNNHRKRADETTWFGSRPQVSDVHGVHGPEIFRVNTSVRRDLCWME